MHKKTIRQFFLIVYCRFCWLVTDAAVFFCFLMILCLLILTVPHCSGT